MCQTFCRGSNGGLALNPKPWFSDRGWEFWVRRVETTLRVQVLNYHILSKRVSVLVWVSGFRVYLDPKEPTFLGLLIMISLYDMSP